MSRSIARLISKSGTNFIENVRSIKPSSCRTFAYAAVNHAVEYKEAIEGRHGQQLELAIKEGQKYDIIPFNPFEAYKVEEDDNLQDGQEMEEYEDDSSDNGDGDEEEDEEEEEIIPTKSSSFHRDGSQRRTKAELASLNAGAPAGGKFAIILLNGTQEKVCVDDVVIMNKLNPVDKWSVGSIHTLNSDEGQVLLLGNQEQTLVGLPFVNGAEVDVMVEEITHDKKVIVFKKKRRKNYRRKNGFKRQVTFLRVLDIRFPDEAKME